MRPALGLAFVALFSQCDACDCSCEELGETVGSVGDELFPQAPKLREAACDLLCTHESVVSAVGTPVEIEIARDEVGAPDYAMGHCGEEPAVAFEAELRGPDGSRHASIIALERNRAYQAIAASIDDQPSYEIGDPGCEFVRSRSREELLLEAAVALLSRNPAVISRVGEPIVITHADTLLVVLTSDGTMSDGEPAKSFRVNIRGPNGEISATVIAIDRDGAWTAIGADLDGDPATIEVGEARAAGFVAETGGGGGWD
jgi:hypothetical protein